MPSAYPSPSGTGDPPYPMDTYLGRVHYFSDMLDPRALLLTPSDVDTARHVVHDLPHTHPSPPSLWDAQRTLRLCTHPDTGDLIPPLLRFSGFIPLNILGCAIMLHPATVTSAPRSLLVHWINQTYNAALNLAHRNASSPVPLATVAQTYVAACALSLSIAYATTAAMNQLPRGSLRATAVRATLPMLAVSLAGMANVALMRRLEWWDEGVGVVDSEGGEHGRSRVAGRQGIAQCCVTRLAWNVPIMTLPLLAMVPLARVGVVKRNRAVTELGLMTVGILVGVPCALGLFPQRASVVPGVLESRFHGARMRDGTPVDKLYFNKGL